MTSRPLVAVEYGPCLAVYETPARAVEVGSSSAAMMIQADMDNFGRNTLRPTRPFSRPAQCTFLALKDTGRTEDWIECVRGKRGFFPDPFPFKGEVLSLSPLEVRIENSAHLITIDTPLLIQWVDSDGVLRSRTAGVFSVTDAEQIGDQEPFFFENCLVTLSMQTANVTVSDRFEIRVDIGEDYQGISEDDPPVRGVHEDFTGKIRVEFLRVPQQLVPFGEAWPDEVRGTTSPHFPTPYPIDPRFLSVADAQFDGPHWSKDLQEWTVVEDSRYDARAQDETTIRFVNTQFMEVGVPVRVSYEDQEYRHSRVAEVDLGQSVTLEDEILDANSDIVSLEFGFRHRVAGMPVNDDFGEGGAQRELFDRLVEKYDLDDWEPWPIRVDGEGEEDEWSDFVDLTPNPNTGLLRGSSLPRIYARPPENLSEYFDPGQLGPYTAGQDEWDKRSREWLLMVFYAIDEEGERLTRKCGLLSCFTLDYYQYTAYAWQACANGGWGVCNCWDEVQERIVGSPQFPFELRDQRFWPTDPILVPGEPGRLNCYIDEYPPGLCIGTGFQFGMAYGQSGSWHFRDPVGEYSTVDDNRYTGPWFRVPDGVTGAFFGWGWGYTTTRNDLEEVPFSNDWLFEDFEGNPVFWFIRGPFAGWPQQPEEWLFDWLKANLPSPDPGNPNGQVPDSVVLELIRGRQQAMPGGPVEDLGVVYSTGIIYGDTRAGIPELARGDQARVGWKLEGSEFSVRTSGLGEQYASAFAAGVWSASRNLFSQAQSTAASWYNSRFDSFDIRPMTLFNDPTIDNPNLGVIEGFNYCVLELFGPYTPITDT
ncbi:MAG: hypothetical protein AAF745_00170 [Planctomycetota bacterium]